MSRTSQYEIGTHVSNPNTDGTTRRRMALTVVSRARTDVRGDCNGCSRFPDTVDHYPTGIVVICTADEAPRVTCVDSAVGVSSTTQYQVATQVNIPDTGGRTRRRMAVAIVRGVGTRVRGDGDGCGRFRDDVGDCPAGVGVVSKHIVERPNVTTICSRIRMCCMTE